MRMRKNMKKKKNNKKKKKLMNNHAFCIIGTPAAATVWFVKTQLKCKSRVQFWGPESGTQNGSAFGGHFCEKAISFFHSLSTSAAAR